MRKVWNKSLRIGMCTALWALFICANGSPVAQAAMGLQVNEQDLLLIPAPVAQLVDVVDVLDVENPSQTSQDMVVTLPSGFQSVSVDGISNANSLIHQNQLKLPGYAKPGTTHVTVTFKLPFQPQQGEQISMHTNYPVYLAKLYLPIGDMALSAEGLQTTTQKETVAGTDYRVFTRLGIPAGDDWGISLQMLPSASGAGSLPGVPVIGQRSSNTGNTIQALGNLLVAAFVLAIGLMSIRSTQWGRTARAPKTQEEALFHGWQNTEQQFQAGMLEETEYRRLREEYKRKLVTLRLKK